MRAAEILPIHSLMQAPIRMLATNGKRRAPIKNDEWQAVIIAATLIGQPILSGRAIVRFLLQIQSKGRKSVNIGLKRQAIISEDFG